MAFPMQSFCAYLLAVGCVATGTGSTVEQVVRFINQQNFALRQLQQIHGLLGRLAYSSTYKIRRRALNHVVLAEHACCTQDASVELSNGGFSGAWVAYKHAVQADCVGFLRLLLLVVVAQHGLHNGVYAFFDLWHAHEIVKFSERCIQLQW